MAFRVTRFVRCWSYLRNYTKCTTLETRNSYRSLCSKVVQGTEDTHNSESNVAEELTTKRKEFSKHMSRIDRHNKLSPALERQARQGNRMYTNHIVNPDLERQARQGNQPYSGSVNWFDEKKGYGFITRDDGEKDVFVHFSAIVDGQDGVSRSLVEGEPVSFQITEGRKGPSAAHVIPTNRSN